MLNHEVIVLLSKFNITGFIGFSCYFMFFALPRWVDFSYKVRFMFYVRGLNMLQRVKKILFNAFCFGIIPQLGALINILILPWITPFLTARDFGIWGIVTAYSGIGISLCTLGLHCHLTNSYYEYKNNFNLVWSRLLAMFLFFAIIFGFFLFIVFIIVLRKDLSGIELYLTAFFGIFPVMFYPNTVLAVHFYPLKSNPSPLIVAKIMSAIVSVSVLFCSVYFFRLGFLGYVFSAAVNTMLLFLFFIKPIWFREKIFPKVDWNFSRMKKWMRIALPVIPHTLGFMLLTSSSRIIMNIYHLPLDEIGIFSQGFLIGSYTNIIAIGLVTALVPSIQIAYRKKNLIKFRNLFYFAEFTTLIAIVFFCIFMPEFYVFFIKNKELSAACPIAQLVCFANLPYPFYCFLSTIALIEKQTTKLLWLVFVPGIINVLLCLIFLPFYGASVAAVFLLFAYWAQIIIPMFVKYYHKKIRDWLKPAKSVLLGHILFFAVVFFASYYISFLSLIVKLGIILIIGSLLIIIGYVFKSYFLGLVENEAFSI